MKFFILVSVVAVCQAGSISDMKSDWLSFKAVHGKTYKSPSEEQYRMKVFAENKDMIDEHNHKYEQGLVSFHLRVNHYADLTGEEFKGLMNKYSTSSRRTGGSVFLAAAHLEVPDSIDWRQKGAVTPVKDQGQCGSCWAFSATGALEGQSFRKTSKLVPLSEQQLVDCASSNEGCDGGLMDDAFRYVMENGGLDSEEAYPYEGVDGECRFRKSSVAVTESGFVDIPEGDEVALMKAVAAVGPVSVAIDAGEPTFQFYSGGVYYERSCSSDELDHGVLVVGYGSERGHDYWLVKNSWNTGWGEKGYVKMARNKSNHCGIASSASYPLL